MTLIALLYTDQAHCSYNFLYDYRHPEGRERAQAFFIVRDRGPQARRSCAIGVGVDPRDLVFLFCAKQKVLPTYSHAGVNACSSTVVRMTVFCEDCL
jgi:hypothetical protein